MNCAQIKERLVDFLYDEMPASERAQFDEHVRDCAECKAAVAAYQRTLGNARKALAGPLMQEPPARVHLAVMEAARAAAKKTPATARRPSTEDEPGFFARLWRTPWFLPACGAASVATVVFLVRVLKNPEVLPGQRPHIVDEQTLAEPAPAAPAALPPLTGSAQEEKAVPPERAAETKAASAPSGEPARQHKAARGAGMGAGKAEAPAAPALVKRKRDTWNSSLDGLDLKGSASGGGRADRFAEPPPARPMGEKKAVKSLDDLLGSVGKARSAEPPAGAPAQPPPAKADLLRDEDSFAAAPGSASAKKAAAQEMQAEKAKPKASVAARPSPAPVVATESVSAGAPAPASAPPHAPTRAAAPASTHAYASPPPSGAYPAEADEEGADLKQVKDADKRAPSLDESVKKADRLYAVQEWGAAAVAYRDLLNRFPSYKDAPKWRERMNQSLVAEQESRKANAAKAAKAAKAKGAADAYEGAKE
jgi:anti-sigma factor RsiW